LDVLTEGVLDLVGEFWERLEGQPAGDFQPDQRFEVRAVMVVASDTQRFRVLD
jgi:hypothetical protein